MALLEKGKKTESKKIKLGRLESGSQKDGLTILKVMLVAIAAKPPPN